MPRATMASLIARLRVAVGDPAGATQVFTDDQLEDVLDERRQDVVLGVLRPDPAMSGSPTVFRAPRLWWEADATLRNGVGVSLAPAASSDPLAGVWEFAAAPTTPVYITGRHYDLYGSAAAVLQAWAAKASSEFDFATDGQRFDRSQKREGLLATAREYMRKAIAPGRPPAWGAWE